MIENHSDSEFLIWFPIHIRQFSPEIAKRLEWMYISRADSMKNAKCKISIYKLNSDYVGFLRFEINGDNINLDYMAVEKHRQKCGIGFELAIHAIEEGLNVECTKVNASVSNAGKRLIKKIEVEYSKMEFGIQYTGF